MEELSGGAEVHFDGLEVEVSGSSRCPRSGRKEVDDER
jgi:hypothetical protein